jgi:hypothetical protein
MAEINQYSVSLRELIELIIKANNVHEGLWSLSVGFGIGIGTFGQTPDQLFPGASVTVSNVGIQRHPPGAPTTGPGVIVVDAAQVNPKAKKGRRA